MSESRRVPIAILLSGRGTNMVSLVRAAGDGRLHADVRVVVSNKADAGGLLLAAELGIPTLVLNHRDFPTREAFDSALADALDQRGVEFVALAGFMRVLTPTFLNRFPRRVINIHPALLPSFPGIHAQAQALGYGARITGCTVHFVDEGTDTGPVIAQVAVQIRDEDDEDTLSARILQQENLLYPQALDDVLCGRLRFEGRRVLRAREATGC